MPMVIEIQVKDGQVTGKLREMEKAIDRLGKTSKTTGSSVQNLGSFLRGFTTSYAAFRGFKAFFETGINIETELLKVQAVTNATQSEFVNLERVVLKLGRTTAFTASQVAQLQFELGKLGFTAGEITRASEGILFLAQATQTNLARAAEIAGMQIRAFNMDAGESTRVADVLTTSVTRSALTMERFAESAKYVAPIAAQLGVNIEETAGVLAALADRGIHGSLAGVALRHMFLRLAGPTARASKEIGGLSLTTNTLAEIFEEMKKRGVSATKMQELFGLRVVSSALVLKGLGANLQDYVDIMEDSEGTVHRISDLMMSKWWGAIRRLKSALEGLTQSIFATAGAGDNLIDKLTWLILKTRQFYIAAAYSNGMDTLNQAMKVGAVGAGAGALVGGPLGALVGGGAGATIGALFPNPGGRHVAQNWLEIEAIAEQGERGATAGGKWGTLIERYNRYIQATKQYPSVPADILGGNFDRTMDESRLTEFEEILNHFYAKNVETMQLFEEIFLYNPITKKYEKQAFSPINQVVDRMENEADKMSAEIFNETTDEIYKNFDKSMMETFDKQITGETKKKKEAFNKWMESYIAPGITGPPSDVARQVIEQEFAGYEEVLMNVLLAGGDFEAAFREVAFAADISMDVLGDLIKQVENYGEAFRMAIQITQQFGQALGSFAVGGGIDALKHGLKQVLVTLLDFLEKEVLAGFAHVGLRALFGDFSAFAKYFGVLMAFETAKGAILSFSSGGVASEVFNGRISNSGLISGPGTGKSDSILARFSNGEAILNANAVNALGVDRINYLNSHGRIPQFAMGGVNNVTNETFSGNVTLNFTGRDYDPFEVFRTTRSYMRKRKRVR